MSQVQFAGTVDTTTENVYHTTLKWPSTCSISHRTLRTYRRAMSVIREAYSFVNSKAHETDINPSVIILANNIDA